MRRSLEWMVRFALGRCTAKTIRRIFMRCLRARPEIWIPLARQSLYTIRIPEFAQDLTLDRFCREDIETLYERLRDQLSDQQFYFATDSEIRVEADGLAAANIDTDFSRTAHARRPVFICAFNSDEKMIAFLKKVKRTGGAVYFTPTNGYPTARYFHRDDRARLVLLEERTRNDSTKFELADFENILQAIAITSALPGPYVEIGVYRGDSARLALRYFRECGIEKACYLIDTYEGFSYARAEQSADARWNNTHTDASVESVERFLSEFPNRKLVKMNVITDAVPDDIRDVSVCNIDVDMYEAVLAAATKMAPRMARGGIMILEDQGHTPAGAGAYLATAEFLQSDWGRHFMPILLYSGQMFLIKAS